MKKNIAIVSAVIIVLVVLFAVNYFRPTEKAVNTNNQTVTTDAVTDIKDDLKALDFGDENKDFEEVNKNINSL